MLTISPSDVMVAVHNLIERFDITRTTRVFGVPRGGVPVALAVSGITGAVLVDNPASASVIVDDIYDSGRTADRYLLKYSVPFGVLFDKRDPKYRGQWLVMPWEITDSSDYSGEDAVVRLLQLMGEDPNREGLKETPARVVAAWREWASGYNVDHREILKTFEDGSCDEMVIVHNTPVVSRCEHHLAEISGIAHVGYVPDGRIVGLSKIPRIIDIFSRRLQVQERLTAQIADALMDRPLSAKGVGVLVRASHGCISSRGVKIHGSITTTSAMRGVLLSKPEARAEFLSLCRDVEHLTR